MIFVKHIYDAVIIGGGASGLMCAVAAKQKNSKLKIAVIEKNDRVGKKLLATGNGRCNLTNRNISPKFYTGSFKKKCGSVFDKIDTDYLLNNFKNLGLLSCCDSSGRYYPLSKQASSVLDVLRFACERLDVDLFCGERIKNIRKNGKGFSVNTESAEFSCKKLVIACGSKASPKLGGNSSAADYLKNLGHTFTPFSPALCPVKVKSELLKSIKGIRATGKATLIRNGKTIKSESGEIQFADNALSGICIFNLSLYAKKDDIISLDLLPDISDKELLSLLFDNKKRFTSLTSDNLLTGILQKRLAQTVLKSCGVRDFSKTCAELSERDIKSVSGALKAFEFTVNELSGFEQAQCARGGVIADEINEKTMQSKKCGGLYICGEAVDICGECGGYNLHFAFASGIIAGESL